jgi:hypothetical protein
MIYESFIVTNHPNRWPQKTSNPLDAPPPPEYRGTMTPTTAHGRIHPGLPDLAQLKRRRAEFQPTQPNAAPSDQTNPPSPEQNPLPTTAPARIPAEFHLSDDALYGVAGHVVRTLAPHSEAHPAAILLQLLAAFGNVIGPGPHCMVDAIRHGLNLFVVLVGESSKARKGTSWSQIARLFSEVDNPWLTTRVTTARLTTPGLIHALSDQQPPTDRRLLTLSEEFASVLHSMGRTRGQLSPLLRSAWDNGHLRSLDTKQLLRATGTHISLIAHITERELGQLLHRTEAHNGFANRCLWVRVQRSQCLPEGGSLSEQELSAVSRELHHALHWAAAANNICLTRNEQARELWHDCYPALSQVGPGLHGAATSRAEAQVLRLSALYSALDCSSIIALPHLQAALAVWDYCSASASHLFGTSTGDATADRIREALDAAPDGLSRKQISALFHGHLGSDRIDAALEKLGALGAINQRRQPGKGRPSTLWSANEDENSAQQET